MQRLFFTILCSLLIAGCSGGNASQAQADYELGVKYLQGLGVPQDDKKAVEYFEKSAASGNAEAELTLGYLYIKGKGVPQDNAKGLALFKQAAMKGHRDAQYNTGLAYARGEVVKTDFAEALKWFEMAALQDDAGSQYNLGVMYINGEGTVADPLTAYAWFKLADDHGYEGAKDGMVAAKASLTSDQLTELDRTVARISGRVQRMAPPAANTNNTPL